VPEVVKYFCVDRMVPPEYAWLAYEKALDENPENASGLEAAILRFRRWKKQRRILHVYFLEGSPIVRQKIAHYAQQWHQYANITFLFDNHPKSEIRIAFQPGGTASYIGTDALIIPSNEPTMNYHDLFPDSPDEDFSYYVLHEFGHAMGLLHEHQSPKAGIKWNRDAVKAYYVGYSDKWIETNIFKHYNRLQARSSTFDTSSIMAYHIPRELTLNNIETPLNRTLSEMDKDFIQQWYPW
jgi:serralysin